MTTFEQQLKYEIDRLSNQAGSNPSHSTSNTSSPNHTTSAPSHTSNPSSNPNPNPNPNRHSPIGATDRVLYAELSHAIVGAAIEVHRHIGPGQLESVYQGALARELGFREIPFHAQVPIEMLYKGGNVGEFFADLIIDDKIIVELKAVTALQAVHTAQVLSYLRATNLRLGLLINFNVPVLWRGVRRLIR